MKKRNLIAPILTVAMLLSSVAIPAAAEEIPDGNWYDKAMTTWADHGIIQGDSNGNLNPERNITRGEMAVILDRLMDYQVTAENTFNDVEVDQWYAEAVLAANAAGIVKGDNAMMRPLEMITREEAAVMFARVLSLHDEAGGTAGYTDEGDISSWAMDAVKSMTAKGYLKGSDGAFRPNAPITRAEVMTILTNVFQGYYNEKGTHTEDVNGTAVISAAGVVMKDMKIAGDLIVAEGVGNGDVILDGVTVGGKLIARGGGENSIIIKGASDIANMVASRQDGKIRVSVEGSAKVKVITVADGSDAVKVEGTVETVTVDGVGATVEITGTVKNVEVAQAAQGAALTVAKTAKVTNLTTAAEGASLAVAGSVTTVKVADTATATKVDVAKGATVSKVETAGHGTAITGDGAVKNVKVTAGEGTTIKTPGTKVEVGKEAGSVATGKGEVKPGQSGSNEGNLPGANTNTGDSGGSTSKPTTYAISLGVDANGTISASRETAASGKTVTITGTPNAEYALKSIAVEKAEGTVVATKTGNNTFTFVMPGEAVTVTPTFEKPLTSFEVFIVEDEASYGNLPEAFKSFDGGPWDNLAEYPWLAIEAVRAEGYADTYSGTDIVIRFNGEAVASPAWTGAGERGAVSAYVNEAPEGDPNGDKLGVTGDAGNFDVTMTYAGATYTGSCSYVKPGVTAFTVNFDVDGGSAVPAQTIVENGVAVKPADPTRLGYTFGSWHADSSAGAEWDFANNEITGNTTIYASWTAKDFTLTYDNQGADGGAGKDAEPATVKFDAVYGQLPAVTKTGCTLKGWFTAATGGDEVTAATTMTTEGATIYAQWIPSTTTYAVTVTVKKDGTAWSGHGKTITLQKDSDAAITDLTAVADGTYKILVDTVDTGKTVTVNGAAATATLDYYTVTFGVTNAGTASNSTVSATYDSKTIASGAVVLGGKTLVITAAGAGADGYTYLWNDATGTTTSALTISSVTAKVDASCAVTGTAATSITVTNQADLTAALANSQYTAITITGDMGDTSTYTQYAVNHAVTIKGGTVYGTFIVKAEGVTFDNVTIRNKGDMSGENTLARGAIYATCNEITITSCTFDMNSGATGITNGVVIYPIASSVKYAITGNTFKGYKTSDSGWTSTALSLVGGSTKLGQSNASVLASLSAEEDLAIITGNIFKNCKVDYSRYVSGSPNAISCTSISNGGNTRFATAADTGAKYYITGDVTRGYKDSDNGGNDVPADLIIKANTEVIITAGSSLTIPANVTLTNNGTITNNGAIVVNDEAGLKTAIAAGGTVKLGTDVAVAEKLVISEPVTLDLNSKTMTSGATGSFAISITNSSGMVTVKNGTIAGSKYGIGLGENAIAVVEGLTIKTTGRALQNNKGTLTIKSGTYSSSADPAIFNNSDLTIEDGNFSCTDTDEGRSVILCKNELGTTSTLNITGGTLTNDFGVGISALGGASVTIDGTTEITAKGPALGGNNTEPTENFTVNGGTLTSTDSAAIFLTAEGNLTITGGTITGKTGIHALMGTISISGDAKIEATGDSTGIESGYPATGSGPRANGAAILLVTKTYSLCETSDALTVTINGGDFTSTATEDITVIEGTKNPNQVFSLEVSGGTYSAEVKSDYLKSGYSCTESGSNWVVAPTGT